MAKYAEIYESDSRVHVVFESDKVPMGNPAVVLYADISLLSPQPKPGWLYDENTNTFTLSDFPVPTILVDLDVDEVKTLLTKASATFTVSDLAEVLKKIAKRLYGIP